MAQLKDLLVNGSARVIGSLYANLSGNVLNFGVCSTAAATAAKTVTTNGTFELIIGSKILVLFSETDTSNAPTLNVNGTGAKSIKVNASDGIGKGFLAAQQYYWFIYDGTNWRTAGAGITQIIPTQYGGTGNSSFTANRIIYSNTATKLASGSITTDGGYLGAVSYLSVNTAHQTTYRAYINGSSYFNGDILLKGKLLLNPSYSALGNSYNEGIRLNRASNGWSVIALGGTKDTTSGTGLGVWLVGAQSTPADATTAAASITSSQFYISYNGSSGATARIQGHNATGFSVRPRLYINTDAGTGYNFYVNGTSYFNGTLDNQDGRLSFVQNKSIIGNTVNWNTLTTPGCYKIQMATWGNAATLHSPNEAQSNLYSFGLLFVFRGSTGDDENRVEQIYFPHVTSNDHPIYCRMHNGSSFDSGWQSWHRLARGNLIKKLTIQANGIQKGQFNNSADVTVNLGNVAQDFTGANSGNAANINADTFAGMTRQQWLNTVYPIGSIYMSVSATSPATLFGGTWEQLENRFLLGAGSSYTSGSTGGSATMAHTHSVTASGTVENTTLTIAQIPAHSHAINNSAMGWPQNASAAEHGPNNWGTSSWPKIVEASIANTGGGQPHNHGFTGSAVTSGGASNTDNMPPYLVVYMWKRTA